MGSPLNPQSPIAISGLPFLGVSSQTDFRPRRPARRGLFLSETTYVRAPYAQSQRHRASALHAEGRKRPILADECNDCFSRQWNGSARRPGSPNRRAHRRSPPGRRGALDTRLRGAGAAVIGPRVQSRSPGSVPDADASGHGLSSERLADGSRLLVPRGPRTEPSAASSTELRTIERTARLCSLRRPTGHQGQGHPCSDHQ